MAVRINLLLMAIGALMIAGGGLGLLGAIDVVGVGVMVIGAIGAAVAMESTEPRPAEQPVPVPVKVPAERS